MTTAIRLLLPGGSVFFTNPDNYRCLTEFISLTKAQVDLVEVTSDTELLTLPKLCKHYVDGISQTDSTVRVVSVGYTPLNRSAATAAGVFTRRTKCESLINHMQTLLLSGQPIELMRLKEEAPVARVYHAFNVLKAKLSKDGRKLRKIRPGIYQLD